MKWLLLAPFVLSALSANAQVPAPVLNKLKSGVNITRWFGYVPEGFDYDHYMKAEDFANLKKLGISFVRLCINPDRIYKNGHPDPKVLAKVDAGIKKLNDAGILVIWDLHDNGQMKLDAAGHDNSGFVSFWKDIATHYKGKSEHEIIFELVNEPVFDKNEWVWFALQKEALAAVRSVDKQRVVVVSGTGWGGIEGLLRLKKLDDSRLIYSAHSYDPFMFSHQGATWAGEDAKHWKNMPFPSSPEAVAKMIDTIEPKYQGATKWYGEQKYDANYIASRFKLIYDYGKKNNVPVLLGEFGSYPLVAPYESRSNWLKGARAALNKYPIAHAIWGYDDGFGLGRELVDGKVKLDANCLNSFYGQVPKK